MEAKGYSEERITKTNEENCHNTLEERLAEQDNISFKAGERKMVKWFMKYGGESAIHYSDGIRARFDPPWNEWQAELEELGL